MDAAVATRVRYLRRRGLVIVAIVVGRECVTTRQIRLRTATADLLVEFTVGFVGEIGVVIVAGAIAAALGGVVVGIAVGIDDAEIVLGVLVVGLGANTVAGGSGVTGEREILLKYLLRRASDFYVGPLRLRERRLPALCFMIPCRFVWPYSYVPIRYGRLDLARPAPAGRRTKLFRRQLSRTDVPRSPNPVGLESPGV
jgi:hypothetical protein